MFNYSFIIYGVFEGKRCVMVGSTSVGLKNRTKGYSGYRWYRKNKHILKPLWEGTIEVCDKEQAYFIRAAKETLWICRMKTWWALGGYNQASPLAQVLGGPYAFEDRAKAIVLLGNKATSLWTKTHPKEAFLRAQRGGLAGGPKGGKLGGKRVRELYPGMAEANGARQGRINADNGSLAKGAAKGRHTRWHTSRGIKNSNCTFCKA